MHAAAPATAAMATAIALLAAGCGLPTDDSFEQIPRERLGALAQTTTTSTTSTTLPSLTTEPPSTVEEPSTTLVQTEPVEVFFVLRRNNLQRQVLQMFAPVTEALVVERLEEGPVDVADSVDLRTALRQGLVAQVLPAEGGIVRVDLDGLALRRLTPTEGRLAIAQIVLSLTRLRGVGQVSFTIDGQPAAIPVPARGGEESVPGEPLSALDFDVMLATSPSTTTTTTTTTTTPPPVETSSPEPTDPRTDPPVDTSTPAGSNRDQYPRRSTRSGLCCQFLSTFTRSSR